MPTSSASRSASPAPGPTHARRRARTPAVAVLVGAVLLAAAACGGSSSEDASSTSGVAASRSVAVAGPAVPAAAADAASTPSPGTEPSDPTAPRVIRTGEVALRSDDVEKARTAVQGVLERLGGQVASEESAADDAGRLRSSRLVLRVPAADFGAAMRDLGAVAELVSTSSTSQDVTTQVIDTDVRVRTQRASIARLRVLFARAGGIGSIVALERELDRRQTALESLEHRQDYLADQTALATIDVTLDRRRATTTPPPPPEHHRGFGAGLNAGWAGLSSTTVTVLTAGGAVLPFALVLLVLAAPVLLLRRRRRPAPVADAAS